MRWDQMRRSRNVEDRRGGDGLSFGGRRFPSGGRATLGGGLGLLVLVIAALLFGVNPLALLQGGGGLVLDAGAPHDPPRQSGAGRSLGQDEAAEFVSAVLGETEDVWQRLFANAGRRYVEPTLVLFPGQVRSACGLASAAVGPFYCPADSKVYLDLDFFDELDRRFGAPGDFAQAYVIAHEIGHHVQKLLGITDRVEAMRGRLGASEYNQLSVRLELQADFFAGVWAHHAERTKRVLEPGDIEEGLRAASAIGDDRIQRRTQGYVVPDSFTHGTSAQRVRWFRKGFETGDINAGDTFTVAEP
ncbi:MAG: neutral zinc metallopeptidase [Phycisphaerae bacterium]